MGVSTLSPAIVFGIPLCVPHRCCGGTAEVFTKIKPRYFESVSRGAQDSMHRRVTKLAFQPYAGQ